MKTPTKIQGVTLIELMIVIVIAAVLLAIGVPAFQDTIDRNRLKAATETLYGDLQFAKSEAIKRNRKIVIAFTTSNGNATWCYGLREVSPCDCTGTDATKPCTIDNIKKVVSNADYPNVKLNPSANITFDNIRSTFTGTGGTACINATDCIATLESAKQKESRVTLYGLGRIKICSPDASTSVPGYPLC